MALRDALLLVLALQTGCVRVAGNGPVDAGRPPAEFEAANRCRSPGDCFDLGPVCGVGCHLPFGAGYDDNGGVGLLMLDAREREAEGRCSISCPGPFWGYACTKGRCVPNAGPPAASECFDKGMAVDCRAFLRTHRLERECVTRCGGRSPDGKLLQIRIETGLDGGGHTSRLASVNYLDCALCAGLDGGP